MKTSSPRATAPARVLLVDDHPAIRAGLRALLESESDFRVVGECAEGTAAIHAFTTLLPDLVVLDLRMPGMSGLDVLKAILTQNAQARIVVNTTFDTDEDIFRAIHAGACSFLTKDLPKEEIFAVLRAVHSGKNLLPSHVKERLQARASRPHLTERELEVLHLLGRGRSNKEMASELHLSEEAIKSRLKVVFQKLGVEDRTGAVLHGLKMGLLKLES
jgi:two-component system NarL family response regulator